MTDKPLQITHEREILFSPVAPAEIVNDGEEGLNDAPPEIANYRPAEIEAIACWNCAHFERTGVGDDNWPIGTCHLWEAPVQGEAVCDRFTVDASMAHVPAHQSETEGASMEYSISELFHPEGTMEFAKDTGLIKKGILRTGEWGKTPGSNGVIKKGMKIVRDGPSDPANRVISLSELVESFQAKAYPTVMLPLSDDAKYHKNFLSLNQGKVDDLWIEDREGFSELMAAMDVTEPTTRDKVLRGTIPDVSSGVHFGVERPDGKKFNSALNHVCFTPVPFIDELSPFEVMASDGETTVEAQVESLVLTESKEGKPDIDERLTFSAQKEKLDAYLQDQLLLGPHYSVTDLAPERAVVTSSIADVSWVAGFSMDPTGAVEVEVPTKWVLQESTDDTDAVEASNDEDGEQLEEPAAAPTEGPKLSPLQQAQKLRVERASSHTSEGGVEMSQITSVDEIDFSDPEKAKEAVAGLISTNQSLSKKSRTKDCAKRITELEEMGFSEMPAFLAKYRDIYLSDDGGPAMVLLSHDDEGNEIGKKQKTALDIADELIAAIPKDKEGKKILLSGINLSDSGNNEPPPAEPENKTGDGIGAPEGDTRSAEERTAAVAGAVGVDVGQGKES